MDAQPGTPTLSWSDTALSQEILKSAYFTREIPAGLWLRSPCRVRGVHVLKEAP